MLSMTLTLLPVVPKLSPIASATSVASIALNDIGGPYDRYRCSLSFCIIVDCSKSIGGIGVLGNNYRNFGRSLSMLSMLFAESIDSCRR